MMFLRSSPFSSSPIVVFVLVLSVLLASDEVRAIRVPDFTTGIKSKFSMLSPKNRAAKARDELLDAAYMDEKIVGWDAVNNQPIYDENWDSNKALLEKYNPGSTERKDLPTYKHVPTREEEQNWLYKDRCATRFVFLFSCVCLAAFAFAVAFSESIAVFFTHDDMMFIFLSLFSLANNNTAKTRNS